MFVELTLVIQMEEEQVPPCPASPHADLKIHPMFNSTGTKLFLVFFNLRNCSTVVCGDCVDVLKVDSKTPKQIGSTVKRHWAGRPGHAPGPSPTEVAQFIVTNSLLGVNEASSSKLGLVLFHEFFQWAPKRETESGNPDHGCIVSIMVRVFGYSTRPKNSNHAIVKLGPWYYTAQAGTILVMWGLSR